MVAAPVVVAGLRKSYGDKEAVRGVDFAVATGEVFALLGPNGAGKTSTVEVLEGFRDRDGGHVEVLGVDPARGGRALRERVGIVLQDGAVDRFLTVAEVVTRNAGYYPDPHDPDEVIDQVGLGEQAGTRVKKLSGGQQRRLDLALGLVGRPELLFLDEPTTGFDPSARRSAWELVRSLRGEGTTVLLTTHYMDEAQALADRVAVIVAGRIVAEGTPESLGGRDTAAVRVGFRLPPGVSAADLPVQPGSVDGDLVELSTDTPTALLHTLTSWATAAGTELPGLRVDRPTLEDVYLQLTGSLATSAPHQEAQP